MEQEFEKKNLIFTYDGTGYEFSVLPFKDNETHKIIFNILLLQKASTIEYDIANGWWQQKTGDQIYTDFINSIGIRIKQHYPELF